MVKSLALVALGGACGALARYSIVSVVTAFTEVAWATAVVNALGSFAVGLVIGGYSDSAWFAEYGRAFVVIGVLGAFTTFSAFSMDTLELMEQGRFVASVIYVVGTVLMCVMCAAVGAGLASQR